jgi:hypothetical protein
MKRILIWLVLRQHYDNSYAWQSAKDIVDHAKKQGMSINVFNIISYNNGEKKTYEAFIDESGLGAIALIDVQTSEETGVEIKIKIKDGDFSRIETAARGLYPYFDTTPNVKNLNTKIQKPEYVNRYENWGLRKSNSSNYTNSYGLCAVMGNIAYPISSTFFSSVKNKEIEKSIDFLEYTPLDLFFSVGELNISASREGLEYDKKTIEAIKEKLIEFLKDFTILIVQILYTKATR